VLQLIWSDCTGVSTKKFGFCNTIGTKFPRRLKPRYKAVPQHATNELGRRGNTAPTYYRNRQYMGVSGQRHAPAAL
jgi:hypothetical protein